MKTAAEKTATAASTPAPKPANVPFFSKVTGTTPTVPAAQSSQKLRGVSAVGIADAVSSELVDISSNTFSPSQKVKDEIESSGNKGLEVRVFVKGLTGEGRVRIRVDKTGAYHSMGGRGSMPLINAWAQQLGGMYINFAIANSEIKGGYASLTPGGGDTYDWLHTVRKNPDLLGGLGLEVGHLPTPVNKFENGNLTLGVNNLEVQVGGYVDALFNLSIENTSKPKIDATADINIKGLVKGQLKFDNTTDKLTGQVSLAVYYDHRSFSGAANIKYGPDGTVAVDGKAAYNADKLSGDIHFVATDVDAANNFAKEAIAAAGGKDNVQTAPPPGPVPEPKPGKKQRALAATGQLAFNLTNWFAGTVNVVVNGKGAITVIGKIAPPGEIVLFKQRDWDREIIKFEAKAYYGIPVIGDLNLFANISLHALASLGPAKLYNIEILGTYSTDPEIQKNIQISGSINISAYGGLRLRAEGGAGVEIASHDLKFGVGVNADVGVKAYADARPTIGYRDPGVFYVSGTLEMVAQPMLGLGGDFFIKLETPWWSPLSDETWTWPLFSKEWPLSNPIGISASVKDYVLGSGATPEIELKPPEFDPSKFMTNMVDKTLPDKGGGPGAAHGMFKEDGSVPKPEVKPKKPAPKIPEARPGKKGVPLKAGKSAAPDSKAAKDQQNAKVLERGAKSLLALKGKGPFGRSGLDAELAKIRGQVSGVDFDVQSKGEKWAVTPKAGGRTGKALELNAFSPPTELKDRPVKFAGETHTLRIQVIESRAQVLMASDDFRDIQDELVLLRRTYLNQHPPAGRLITGKQTDAAEEMDKRLRIIAEKKNRLARRALTERNPTKKEQIETEGLAELEQDVKEMGDYLVSTYGTSFGDGAKAEAGSVIYVVKHERAYRVIDVGRIESGHLGVVAQPVVGGDALFLRYTEYKQQWQIPSSQGPPPFGGFRPGTGTQERRSVNAQRGINLGGTVASHTPPGLLGQWNRKGHLVAREFGGPGDSTNIVAMTYRTNHENVGMRSIEIDAARHLDGGAAITYRARPEYSSTKRYFESPPDTIIVEVDEVWPKPTPVKFKKSVNNVP